MSDFNPRDWYWIVAGDQAKVYSSARGDFVAIADAAYVAWLAQDNRPTAIDSAASLGAVLAPYLARPTHAAVLDGYQGAQADTVLAHLSFKIQLNHENRLRAIERQLALNGSPANLTANQARNFIKGQM